MLNTLNFRRFVLIFSDIFLLYCSLLAAVFLGFGKGFSWQIFAEHLLPFSIVYFFWLVIFYIFGLYDLAGVRLQVVAYPKIIWALLVCLGTGMAFFYLVPVFGLTPKSNLFLNVLIFAILFFIWRRTFYSLFSSRFFNKAAILGKNPQKTKLLAKEIAARPYLGYQSAAIFEKPENLLAKIQEKKIDTLIVDESEIDFDFIEGLYQCLEARVNFMDWNHAYELFCEKIPVDFLDKKWFLENLREGERKLYDKTKRALDIIISALILIGTLPVWLLIALLIKLEDRGPVLYRQKRVGKDRRVFELLKFRSMKADAEAKTGPVWAQKQDSRVTKVGKILRNLHLDELPQMINVLKGEISLVGPRPERPAFVQELEKQIPHYHLRHLIRPGFTGWAQLKFRYGRTIMDAKEKFEYDLYYLKNRGLFLDLGILLKTFQLFFKNE